SDEAAFGRVSWIGGRYRDLDHGGAHRDIDRGSSPKSTSCRRPFAPRRMANMSPPRVSHQRRTTASSFKLWRSAF
ncbi:MAG TPA: hypothetical protein VK439_01250, partial [Rubrivivax sp.]|nr:hypothetical protein [Rubrivivax sp.]